VFKSVGEIVWVIGVVGALDNDGVVVVGGWVLEIVAGASVTRAKSSGDCVIEAGDSCVRVMGAEVAVVAGFGDSMIEPIIVGDFEISKGSVGPEVVGIGVFAMGVNASINGEKVI
jgi:hypothetical protein